jgi:GDP/UDP-N,N'-diacetylbacillosamine 2-epimerase (hydrolysing)
LRHAITKLSHFHFAATQQSRERILNLGEHPENVFLAGTPGLDGITTNAVDAGKVEAVTGVSGGQFALLILHPTVDDEQAEYLSARQLAAAVLEVGVPRLVIVRPNNDPGHEGINRCWDELAADTRIAVHADIARPAFLGLLRDAAFLIGNSSSGIIEAASFGTPVIDVGPRQAGRERSGNVQHASTAGELSERLRQAWNGGKPDRWHGRNVYGEGGAGERIAGYLAGVSLKNSSQRKLITY